MRLRTCFTLLLFQHLPLSAVVAVFLQAPVKRTLQLTMLRGRFLLSSIPEWVILVQQLLLRVRVHLHISVPWFCEQSPKKSSITKVGGWEPSLALFNKDTERGRRGRNKSQTLQQEPAVRSFTCCYSPSIRYFFQLETLQKTFPQTWGNTRLGCWSIAQTLQIDLGLEELSRQLIAPHLHLTTSSPDL